MESPYLDLTAEFNRGRLRALFSSGQAVAFHRLAVMCKDGDRILREDQETLDRVLEVLARYREAAERWEAVWPAVQKETEGLPLLEAHRVLSARAEGVLPYAPVPGGEA